MHVELPDYSVPELLTRAAAAFPDRIAADFMGSRLHYCELADRVARVAQGLLDLGVQPGDRVAIALPNCTSHVVAFYAVVRIGAIAVEHNPTYSAAQHAHQFADSGARVAIVWTKAAQQALDARAESALETVIAVDVAADLPWASRLALRLPVRAARATRASLQSPVPREALRWRDLLAATPLAADHPFPSPDDVALVQYTGGTTGTPKGAILLHRNLVANVAQCEAWTGMRRGEEVFYAALPFFHAFGLTTCLLLGNATASTLVIFPKFDAVAMVAAQRRRPGTFLPAVPPMLERFTTAARASAVDLTSFAFAFAGAMPLPAETAAAWEDATGGYAIEGYGMTETSPVALGNPVSEQRRAGFLGLPFPHTEIRVVNPESADPVPENVPDGERGELLIRGPQVFAGYWNRPEDTAHQLLPGGWVRTGDIVVRGEDGFVRLVDRIKEMIVTGGFKVYPTQVEDHLREMPGVADVAIVGVPAGDLGEKVVAAVVLDGTVPSLSIADVRAWAAHRLSGYAMPKELHVMAELPRSIVGKVLRRVVRDEVIAR